MVRYLSTKVEMLRKKMMVLAMEKGSLLDEEVIAVSQQLDQELVKLQRLLMNKGRIVTRVSKVQVEFVEFVVFKKAMQIPSRKWRATVSSRLL